MRDLGQINPREVAEDESSAYSLRVAARAIVIDREGKVALLHVVRDGYYKLPGGGVEEGEDIHEALKRECQEEIGCAIEVVDEVGKTIEYFKEDVEKQTSYCYLTKLVGDKGIPILTESESERGFVPVWLSYDEAVEKLRTCEPSQWEAEYIVPRELIFLEAARDKVKRTIALIG